ncbi:unnamed protein product [Urochloa humidicola]
MDRSGGVTTGSGMGAQLFPLGEGARWPARSSDASAWQVIPRELEALNHEHPRSPTTSRGNRRGNDADGGWSEIGARRLDPGAGQGGRPAMAGAASKAQRRIRAARVGTSRCCKIHDCRGTRHRVRGRGRGHRRPTWCVRDGRTPVRCPV